MLIDEYQDTNTLQAEIVMAMKPHGAGVCVVGDDAQAIYSFRAATIENILQFPTHFTPAAENPTSNVNRHPRLSVMRTRRLPASLTMDSTLTSGSFD